MVPSLSLFAQEKITVALHAHGQDSLFQRGKFRLKEAYANDFELDKALQSLILRLQGSGYAEASVDSQRAENGTRHIYLHIGRQYSWGTLGKGNLPPELLPQVGYKEKFFTGASFNYRSVNALLNRILTYHENNGYPFAQVRLDSLALEDNVISAAIRLEKNRLVHYDTASVEGDTRISKKFLYSYLGFKPNGLYSESVIRKAGRRMSELAFVQEEKPLQVLFLEEKARLHFTLKDRRASRFDFLLGILPNNEITGRVLITGELLMDLVSPFGRGERFYINWKRLQARTQNLDVGFNYPYLLSTPIGIDFEFKLYKRDTLYLDLDWEGGFQYLFAGGNYFKAFVHNKITNVLFVDTIAILNTRRLPAINDVRNTLFGVEYFNENLDYRINPRSGYTVQVKAAAGTRRIRELSAITGLSDPENPGGTFESLYDSLDLNSVQYKFDYRLDKYWKVAKRSTVKSSLRGGALISNNIFFNELYRIGGMRLLRGFDEESLFTSLFNVLTLEYRFFLSQNSYFNIFFDGAYTESRIGSSFESDFPFGFGAGLTFETKAGLFGVAYALGRQQDNAIDFRSAKIHFGYVNYF